MLIGRKVYFEKQTGIVLLETGEMSGEVQPRTVDEDIKTYKALSDRNRETFDVIELEHGQYAQDFAECRGFRINKQTKEIEFSYPDPNQPVQPLVFQKPMSEQIKELKSRQESTEEAISFLLGL